MNVVVNFCYKYFLNNFCKHLVCTIFIIAALRLIFKRYFVKNVTVNCWFCNKNSYVLKSLKDAFICQYCDQYNGFKEDGDYNMIMPCQLYEELNPNRWTTKSKIHSETRTFCNACIDNETKKINLLNRFNSTNEDSYYEEYDDFKRRLDKMMPLCYVCEIRAQDKLNDINNEILPKYIKWSAQVNKNKRMYKRHKHMKVTPIILILVSLIAMLVLQIVPNFGYEYKFVLSFCPLFMIVLMSKLCNLPYSIKFNNIKLFYLLMIVMGSSILSKYNRYLPSILRNFLGFSINLWMVLLLLDFSLKVARLVKSVSLKKIANNLESSSNSSSSCRMLTNPNTNNCNSMNIETRRVKQTNIIVENAKNDTTSMYSNQPRSTVNPFVLSRSISKSYKDNDSACSFRSQNSCNLWQSKQNNVNVAASNSGDISTSYLFKGAANVFDNPFRKTHNEVQNQAFTDDNKSLFSYRTGLTNKTARYDLRSDEVSSASSEGPYSVFSQYPRSLVSQPQRSIVSHYTDSTVRHRPGSVVSQYPGSSVSQRPQSVASYHTDSKVSHRSGSVVSQYPGSMKPAKDGYSDTRSVSSAISRKSRRCPPRATLWQISIKLIVGVVIGGLLNLLIMMCLVYAVPNIESYL